MRSIAVIGTGFQTSNSTAAPREIQTVKGDGFDPRLWQARVPTFPVNEINRHMSEIAIIETGLRAAQDGCGGIFINTVGDYGLSALRSSLSIPVVGAGQSTMHTAAQMGRRFSIVTIWPPQLLFIYRGLLRLYEVEQFCASVRCVSVDEELDTLPDEENFITDMQHGESKQQERILLECKRAIQDDGADTILLGCTCMSPIAEAIASQSTVPILNPATTGYKILESMMELNLSHSKVEFTIFEDFRPYVKIFFSENFCFIFQINK